MLDGFSTTMREHVADCYKARGLSVDGSEQLANQQKPSNPADQAMMGAYKETVLSPMCFEKNEYGMPREIPCSDSKPDMQSNNGNFWNGGQQDGQTKSNEGNVWGADAANSAADTQSNLW